VRHVAGAIARSVRAGGQVDVVGMGPRSINQAIKALAITREFLEKDGLDFTCRPKFVHIQVDGDANKASERRSALTIRLNVTERRPTRSSDGTDTTVLKIASQSVALRIAGALAKNVRKGQRVEMVAMGPEPVNQAVKAIAIAREYLVDDFIDIEMRPTFIHIEGDNTRRSAIQFTVLAHQN
jgi:stage V sporulation protein S